MMSPHPALLLSTAPSEPHFTIPIAALCSIYGPTPPSTAHFFRAATETAGAFQTRRGTGTIRSHGRCTLGRRQPIFTRERLCPGKRYPGNTAQDCHGPCRPATATVTVRSERVSEDGCRAGFYFHDQRLAASGRRRKADTGQHGTAESGSGPVSAAETASRRAAPQLYTNRRGGKRSRNACQSRATGSSRRTTPPRAAPVSGDW